MTRPYTWEQLAALTLCRQFPSVRGRGIDQVIDVIGRTGPIQSQAARAPYLSLAARLPGVRHATVTAAHESLAVVRSTSLRGTVHTSTRDQHADLASVAMRSLVAGLRRGLLLDDAGVIAFRSELERLATEWKSHDAVVQGVVDWMRSTGRQDSIATLDGNGPRYLLRGHPAMLRRPSGEARWESQAEVVYRAAGSAIGEAIGDPQTALVSLVRHHIAASGPVSRRDLAWWSGGGLRNVDAVLASLGEELNVRHGPDGLDYYDLVDAPRGSSRDLGIRLLPEYDALLLAYDPAARDRFADAEAVSYSWNKRNGVHSPTVLVDGRLRGIWQLERGGGEASIVVRMFPGEGLPDASDFAEPASALGAVLDIPVTDVRVGSVVR